MGELASYTILFTGLNAAAEGVRALLARDSTAKVTSIDIDDPAGAQAQVGDVIVIGPRAQKPYVAAELLRQRSPSAQVVFLVESRKLEMFRAALPFVPHLSDAWTVAIAEPAPKITAVIFEAARTARHRDSLARVRDRINAQIALRTSEGELARRERHMLLSERYMATVLQQAPDPIFALDLDANILSSNDAAREAFALPADPDARLPAEKLFARQARAQATLRLSEACAGATIVKWFTFMRNRAGEPRECSLSLAPVRDSQGQVTGVAMIARDITSYQRMQRHLEERTRELEAMIAQRDMLLREVYHRVKNNLQVVDALTQMEMRRIDDPRAKAMLDGLRQRVHTIGLVHQQLMTSDDLETIELRDFFAELADRIAAMRVDPGEIELDVAPGPQKLTLDVAVPLGLIVTELLTNALKHGHPAQGTQHISLRFRDGDGRGVVTVKDNGAAPGGAESLLAGKGVGAKIVMGLAQQIDGEIRADFDQGTEVAIHFPLERRNPC